MSSEPPPLQVSVCKCWHINIWGASDFLLRVFVPVQIQLLKIVVLTSVELPGALWSFGAVGSSGLCSDLGHLGCFFFLVP